MATAKVLHDGELRIHRALGVPPEVSARIPYWAATELDDDKGYFFESRYFVAFASVGPDGWPWATIFTREQTILRQQSPVRLLTATAADTLKLHAESSYYDPVSAILRSAPRGTPWAVVGIDFEARDRVLAEGEIRSSRVIGTTPEGRITLGVELAISSTTGNCPKYITSRRIDPRPAAAHSSVGKEGASSVPPSSAQSGRLDVHARELICNSDTLFVATRYRSPSGSMRMHLNHRGGPRGFARVDPDGSLISWPEYSGNRKYTSLGNIEADGVAGVVFVDWRTGDALHITGTAVVKIGDAAVATFPRSNVAVTMTAVKWVLIRGAISVTCGPAADPSPYNPPLRLLAGETSAVGADGGVRPTRGTANIEAEVMSATPVTSTMTAFTLRLCDGATLAYNPGQYVILDFKAALPPLRYAHMNDRNPQLLNDDLVRAYTISSAPARAAPAAAITPATEALTTSLTSFVPAEKFTITVKLKHAGNVSNFLHAWAAKQERAPLRVNVLGVSGNFSVFSPRASGGTSGELVDDAAAGAPVLFLAAGSGVTPFLAMLRALGDRVTSSPRLHVLLTTRVADAPLAEAIATASCAVVTIDHFITDDMAATSTTQAGEQHRFTPHRRTLHRRMTASDVADAVTECRANGGCNSAWLCGPTEFAAFVRASLAAAGVTRVHEESFDY